VDGEQCGFQRRKPPRGLKAYLGSSAVKFHVRLWKGRRLMDRMKSAAMYRGDIFYGEKIVRNRGAPDGRQAPEFRRSRAISESLPLTIWCLGKNADTTRVCFRCLAVVYTLTSQLSTNAVLVPRAGWPGKSGRRCGAKGM
jgi:hypothetical protein